MNCLVAGAGGFIGGHLVKRLLDDGHNVETVDIKPLPDWWQSHNRSIRLGNRDLRSYHCCLDSCLFESHPGRGAKLDRVYNLAADMGGMGFIESHKADCMVSVLINTNLLRAAVKRGVGRYFFASSACVYHADVQKNTSHTGLREEYAYYNGGAMPEDGYGWEKLFSERMCRHFHEDFGLETRVARFHNVYGPHGSWCDGREKAPAALCRKVAIAKGERNTSIEVWGDGTATRSFCWIDDCIEGIIRLTESNYTDPINVGSDKLISVNNLICLIEDAAEWQVSRKYDTTKPRGVAGRNSDNAMIRKVLGWEPSTTLQEGIAKTYEWVEEQVKRSEV